MISMLTLNVNIHAAIIIDILTYRDNKYEHNTYTLYDLVYVWNCDYNLYKGFTSAFLSVLPLYWIITHATKYFSKMWY